MKKISISLVVLLALVQYPLFSQNAQEYNFVQKKTTQGVIIDDISKAPLSNVKVTIKELNITVYSNQDGVFEFLNIPSGNYTLICIHPDYINFEEVFSPNERLFIQLLPNSLELEELVILGKSSNLHGATSTHINRKAIEHLQATSLQEVLQLVPGNIITNPNLSGANQANIRQYESDKMGSLGTSVIVNGAALSNNANLQAINTATSGSGASFSSSSGAGVDLRAINADNIESVEVIRGIPSVEYGDLNNGALIVQTKATKEPLQIKGRFNPKLTQFWAGKGFQVSESSGTLFVDVDFTKSNDSETNLYQKYNRFSGNAQYTDVFGENQNWRSNTTLGLTYSHDIYDMDPDFIVDQMTNNSKERNIRFTTNGIINLDAKYSETFKYTIATNYGIQDGYQQQFYTADITAESHATESGTNEVAYLPSSYLSRMWVNGKPFNFTAKVSNQFHRYHNVFSHAILAGFEWNTDANFGEGKTFTRPPRNTSGASYRTRAFKNIPALNQFGIYLQDHVNVILGDHQLTTIAGLRFDVIQPTDAKYNLAALSPRINILWDLPQNLTIRGGYGITTKAPTLLYLYPENAYFDFYSLNHYKENQAERLALITTHVYDSENVHLKLSKTQKAEIGFDYKWKNKRFSFTAYKEHTKNGYSMSTSLQSVKFAETPIYQVIDQPLGQAPVLSDQPTYETRFVSYNAPSNNINRTNKGVEFEFDLGKVNAINTSFNINGAYTSTKSLTNNEYILQQNVAGKKTNRIGIFAPGRGAQDDRFITTIRAIHHIPQLRFIVSLTAQTIWVDQNKYIGYDSRPIGYIPIEEGNGNPSVIYLTEEERQQINVIDDPDLYLAINDQLFLKESWKPLWLFNLKLTKEFESGMNFSFFANNFINNRPLQSSSRNPNSFTKRNIDFFFGMELSIKL